jgi:hypothetical protein
MKRYLMSTFFQDAAVKPYDCGKGHHVSLSHRSDETLLAKQTGSSLSGFAN